ncbi:MAG: hypothetical protein HQK65_18150, partial [Desulfamplus sp.]|nr:hypothetical protein [Desulfamplus sp.]
SLGMVKEHKEPSVMTGITIAGKIAPAQRDQEIRITGDHIEPITLYSDAAGGFEGYVVPQKSGNTTITAHSGEIASLPLQIYVHPGKTSIALTSDVKQSSVAGDTLKLNGIASPVQPEGTKIRLKTDYFNSNDLSGESQTLFVKTIELDESGKFSTSFNVPGNGFVEVLASVEETADFLRGDTRLIIPIGQPIGEGLIVVPETGSNKEIAQKLGAHAYDTLMNRNISKDRIKYLGTALDSITPDGLATKYELEEALTEWAISLMSTEDPYKTPLNLYFIGQSVDGGFKLNDGEILTSDDLSQYLFRAESRLREVSPQSNGFPITVVLEGSQSGAWIEPLAGDGRITLTSSSMDLNKGGFAKYDCNGDISFTQFFYQNINYGADIETAFAEANYDILSFYNHIQKPLMDADGDGKYIPEFDNYAAANKYLEYRPSGNLKPTVLAANAIETIDGGVNSDLWAVAVDPEKDIKNVFCNITDPFGETTRVELAKDTGNRYSNSFSRFTKKGEHQLVYYATDNAGNCSWPLERLLNVITPVTQSAPILTVSTQDSQVTISWTSMPDQDGYVLLYAPYPDAEYIGEVDMGQNTSISFDGNGLSFYVAIQAYQGVDRSGYSNIEFFSMP